MLSCALAVIFCSGLSAATFDWDAGGSDDDWSTGANWVGNTPPVSASNTRLEFGTGTTANNDFGSFTLEEIIFEASLGSGDFTITGNLFNFAGTTDIDVNHTGTAAIANDFTLGGNLQVRGNNGATLTISGDINPSSPGGLLTKFDNHTLVLSGSNQFSSRIRIRGGVVESTNSNAIDAPRIDFEDDLGGGQTPTLRISTQDQTYTGTLRAESDDTGYIDVGDGLTFTVNGSGDALEWISAGSAFIKQGDGTLALEKGSSGDGDLTIEDGTVLISDAGALGDTSGATIVQSGGSLGLAGGITVSGEALDLAGAGHAGQGALFNNAGDNTWNNDITVSADATIANNDAGSTLTVGLFGSNQTVNNNGNTVTLDGAGDILFNAQFTGSGGLIKNGTGTSTLFYGGNSSLSVYSGPTTVNSGTLITDLGDGIFTPLTGTITIGDGVGTDTLQTRWFNNIGDSTAVNVNSSGVLEVGGFYANGIPETIGALTLEGGALVQSVDGASGDSSIILNGDVTRVAAGSNTANIDGRVELNIAARVFDVADAAAASDLDVGAILSNGGLVKNGAGTMTLSGTASNTYTGDTVVNAGTLELNKTAGLDAVAGDIVVNGGTLLLGNSNQIVDNSAMTLAGGTFDSGGNSETLDTLTLDASSTIDMGNAGTINFATSIGESWSGTLFVTNWAGNKTGGGSNQLIFGSSTAGLTTGQLNSIRFINPTGFSPGTYYANILSSGEIVPVIPEPSTYMMGGLLSLVCAVGYWRRRREARASVNRSALN